MAISIKAEMAGTIMEILVEEGQAVGPDDEVMVLSSMKMEIPILAGAAGAISELLVEEQETVKVGTPLFTIVK